MRRFHKLITGILALTMLFALTSTAMAAATPYVLVRRCFECENGTVYRRDTEKFDEEIHRQHGSHYDIYYEYEVTIREYCDSCNYTYEHTYEREDLHYCPSQK